MKLRAFLTTLTALTATILWAQAGRPPATAAPTSATTTPTAKPPATSGGAATTTGASGTTTGGPAKPAAATTPGTAGQPSTASTNNNPPPPSKMEGFDGIGWGMTYKEMKDRFRVMASNANAGDNVEIISDTPDREILVRRREIQYRYVFYKKPPSKSVESMPKPEAGKPAEKPAEKDETAGTAKFFFVESIFPLLKSDELYTKLSEKYGQRTGSSIGDTMRGANTWEKDEGFLVQWVEPYAKQGYTRSLYYISRKIRDEIKTDLMAWQFVRELKAIDSLLK